MKSGNLLIILVYRTFYNKKENIFIRFKLQAPEMQVTTLSARLQTAFCIFAHFKK